MAPHTTVNNETSSWGDVNLSSTSTSTSATAQLDTETSSLLEDEDTLEPVAIVGLSLKFPQDATSADGFWKTMMEGRCTATEFPSARLSVTAIHHPDPNRRDTVRRTFLSLPLVHTSC